MQACDAADKVPLSVIIPTRNEAANLPACLASVGFAGDIRVVDSRSTDGTQAIAKRYGAMVHEFRYRGGWPKKRQWALDHLPLVFDWVLLLDADERVTPELRAELAEIIARGGPHDGYFVRLTMSFLGRRLRFGATGLEKLVFFRRGKGRFECRFTDQDSTMGDMEVHEHVLVEGSVGRCRACLDHHNVHSLACYIEKHNAYSNWEAELYCRKLGGRLSEPDSLRAAAFGNRAQRRRWLKQLTFRLPGTSVALFLYLYLFRGGFLDRVPGLIYCGLQAVQQFHVKAKVYEKRLAGAMDQRAEDVADGDAIRSVQPVGSGEPSAQAGEL